LQDYFRKESAMYNIRSERQVCYCINAGSADADTELNAFDRALLNAGCGNYNLLKVSSILPAGAERNDKITELEGSLLPIAYACITAGPDENIGDLISAAVAIGIPSNGYDVGVIMEYESICTEEEAHKRVIAMAKTAMADRKVTEYTIECASSSCVSVKDKYNCAFAYVAIFD
jgi:arginine decarboxylase